MSESIDDIIQRMIRVSETRDNESIDSIQARISTVHALTAESSNFGRGALMRAQQLRGNLISKLRKELRAKLKDKK